SKIPTDCTFFNKGLIIVQLPIKINIIPPIKFATLLGIKLTKILLNDIDIMVPTIVIMEIIRLLINPISIFLIPYDNPTTKLSALADKANNSEENIFMHKPPYNISIIYILFIIWWLCYYSIVSKS